MPHKRSVNPRYEQIIIQLDPISNQIPLSTILYRLISNYQSIIGITRVADYSVGLLDSTIFLFMADAIEARKLLNQRKIWIEGQLVQITDPALIMGIAQARQNYAPGEMSVVKRCTPNTITVLNLNVKGESHYTINTLKVIEAFEPFTRLIGFKFAYCNVTRKIRPFGTLFLIQTCRDVIEFKKRRFFFRNKQIAFGPPRSVPILLHCTYEHLLTNKRCELSPLISKLNYLHADIADINFPMHPNSFAPHWIEKCSFAPLPNDASEEHQPTRATVPEQVKMDLEDVSSSSLVLSIGMDYQMDDDGRLKV